MPRKFRRVLRKGYSKSKAAKAQQVYHTDEAESNDDGEMVTSSTNAGNRALSSEVSTQTDLSAIKSSIEVSTQTDLSTIRSSIEVSTQTDLSTIRSSIEVSTQIDLLAIHTDEALIQTDISTFHVSVATTQTEETDCLSMEYTTRQAGKSVNL